MRIIIENADQRDFNELAKLARAGKIHDFCMTDENECENCSFKKFSEDMRVKLVDVINAKGVMLNRIEIEKIISEKYNLNPQNGDAVTLFVESKTVNYDTVDARKIYYPIAYIWKEEGDKE